MEKKTLRQVVIAGVISVVAVASTILANVNLSNAKKTSSSDWMKELDGNLSLAYVSLPGSHDSGALYSIGDLAGKCQDASISKQLESGARFLDMRLSLKDDGSFKVIHGIVDERLSFNEVLKDVKSFLTNHPSETVVMSVKREDDKNKDLFAEKFEALVAEDTDLWYTANLVPTVSLARGKIVLVSRYNDNTKGIDLAHDWQDSATFNITNLPYIYHIQDNYCLQDNETKWNDIVSCLEFSSANILPNVYTINFCSGYLKDGFPPSYSITVAKEINKLALKEIPNYSCTGTILFDFFSEELAKAVYERNFA